MKMKTEDILEKLEGLKYLEIEDFILSLDLTKEQFQILSKNEDMWVRWAIAEHPDLPKYLMYKWVEDEDAGARWSVRWRIVERPDLPKDLMYKWVEDEDESVRQRIAEHPNLPEDLMYKMSEDENGRVRRTIAQRPDLSEDLIIRVSCGSSWGTSTEGFKKLEELNNLKSVYLENAYDLIRTSKYIGRKEFEKTFNYIISNFPELSEAAKWFKNIILIGKRDLK